MCCVYTLGLHLSLAYGNGWPGRRWFGGTGVTSKSHWTSCRALQPCSSVRPTLARLRYTVPKLATNLRMFPVMPCPDVVPPRVFRRAGGSLVGASWAANDAVARVGRRAELQTAEVLELLAGRPIGPTVLHDLAIPIPGITANIGHVVVSGRRVLIIDSKGWKPARYWSLGGATFRGFRRFEHAKTGTPRMAHQALTGYLRGRGVKARLVTPVVAVWSSSSGGRISVTLLGMDGCRPVRGKRLTRAVRRSVGLHPADPEVVAALARLVNPGPRRAGSWQQAGGRVNRSGGSTDDRRRADVVLRPPSPRGR